MRRFNRREQHATRTLAAIIAAIFVLIAACTPTPVPTIRTPPTKEILPSELGGGNDFEAQDNKPTETATASVLSAQTTYGYTYHRPDGNRLVSGHGRLPELEPHEIQLDGTPRWLAAAPAGTGSIWAVVFEDGRVQAFLADASGYRSLEITPNSLPPGAPPLLAVEGERASLLISPGDASTLTHPVPLPTAPGRMAYIAQNGDLVLWDNGEIGRLAIDALPDGRILVDEGGRLLLLAGTTERYDHAALGDALEATRVLVIEARHELRLTGEIVMQNADVIEGIAPIWTDLDQDGQREIIVTVSNRVEGAGLVVYREDGSIMTASMPIGQGYRWRNQLAVAPTSPDGVTELINVITPHINGLVEFLRFDGQRLEITARVPGYTSHVLGSRNLDMALTGDFDSDGLAEALLPTMPRTELGAIRRSEQRADPVWSLPLNGALTTNLAAVELPEGEIALGAGTQSGKLFIWHP